MSTGPLDEYVNFYVRELAGPNDEDARHSLVEAGPKALPELIKAFYSSPSRRLRLALIQIVSEYRVLQALPLLERELTAADTELWKAALDGLVMLGGLESVRTLESVRPSVGDERKEWIDEAIQQIKQSSRHV